MSSKAATLMMFVILDHDAEHEKFEPGAAMPYRAQWLAFRERDRKVFVEVEADDPAGLARFRQHYKIGRPGAQAEERADHSLPGDATEWRSLVGEREAGDDSADSMKHVRRRDRLAERFERERRDRARDDEQRRAREQTPAVPPAPDAPRPRAVEGRREVAPESQSVPDPANNPAAVVIPNASLPVRNAAQIPNAPTPTPEPAPLASDKAKNQGSGKK